MVLHFGNEFWEDLESQSSTSFDEVLPEPRFDFIFSEAAVRTLVERFDIEPYSDFSAK